MNKWTKFQSQFISYLTFPTTNEDHSIENDALDQKNCDGKYCQNVLLEVKSISEKLTASINNVEEKKGGLSFLYWCFDF